MCGIIGYVGYRNVADLGLKCLRKLEYRGYDSCGIAVVRDGKIKVRKGVGKIDEVDKKVGLRSLNGHIGILHTRWSTHGEANSKNAHPHCDHSGGFSIVHNGIIENYAELRKKLQESGHTFHSSTDSEVVVHLIAQYYKGDLLKAVLRALKDLEGSYAFGIISAKEPDKLIAARNESPLVVGVGKGENFIASDMPAIISETKKAVYLKNKEIAVLRSNDVTYYDSKGKKIKKTAKTINLDPKSADRGLYDHYMIKEIFEQPRVIEETIQSRIVKGRVDLSEIGLSMKDAKSIKRIIIVACGTSWHAGLSGEFMLEELSKIPVEVEYASEFRYRNPIIEKGTLVIAISQSGETADTLAAMREAKKHNAKILSIVNVEESSIARESDYVLYMHAGPEIGVASTKAFTSMLAVLYLLTIYLGDIRSVLPKQQVRNRIRDIRAIPHKVQEMLEGNKWVSKVAKRYVKVNNALYLGRGNNFPIALEGALKLKEVSYIHAEGYPAAEMKHGPIALIDKHMPVFVVATKDDLSYSKVLSNIEEVRSRKGEVVALCTKGDTEVEKHSRYVIWVPRTSYILSPLLANIAFQLFAYHVAVLRGCDVDQPRNLAKAVVVE